MDMAQGEKRVRRRESVTGKLTSPYAKETAKGNVLHVSGNSNWGSAST